MHAMSKTGYPDWFVVMKREHACHDICITDLPLAVADDESMLAMVWLLTVLIQLADCSFSGQDVVRLM